jgi:hypothetical protein
VAEGISMLAVSHDFGGKIDISYSRREARSVLKEAADSASLTKRSRADLLGALMTDAATKDEKDQTVIPTPLCLLFGQGHQHFLGRLASVPQEPIPPRSLDRQAAALTPAQCLSEALFESWHRQDRTFSFRWDPEEDVRYALMAGDPTAAAYKPGTQHGANRLAAVGVAALTIVPQRRAGKVRPTVIGGEFRADGFSFAWPIWKLPITLSGIRALLSHPELRERGALAYLGVEYVLETRRISVGKFMNFSRARALR